MPGNRHFGYINFFLICKFSFIFVDFIGWSKCNFVYTTICHIIAFINSFNFGQD